jgi:hypothetical protein
MPAIRRIVKGTSSQSKFKIAAVRRDPFKKEYIDLCNQRFGDFFKDEQPSQSLFEQIASRGQHAVERSEILKAQSITLCREVDGALGTRHQQQGQPRQEGQENEQEQGQPGGGGTSLAGGGGDNARLSAGSAAVRFRDKLQMYRCVLDGRPLAVAVDAIMGIPVASSAAASSAGNAERRGGIGHAPKRGSSQPNAEIFHYSSSLLLRTPGALEQVLALAPASELAPTCNTDDTEAPDINVSEFLAHILPPGDNEDDIEFSEDEQDALDAATAATAAIETDSSIVDTDLASQSLENQRDAADDGALDSDSICSITIEAGGASTAQSPSLEQLRAQESQPDFAAAQAAAGGQALPAAARHSSAISSSFSHGNQITAPAQPLSRAPRKQKQKQKPSVLLRNAVQCTPCGMTVNLCYTGGLALTNVRMFAAGI